MYPRGYMAQARRQRTDRVNSAAAEQRPPLAAISAAIL